MSRSAPDVTLPSPAPGALYVAPILAALGAVAAGLILPAPTLGVAANAALVSSLLLFGLPHGAADWWVMRLAAGRRWTLPTQAGAAAVYVLAAGLALAFWRWRPGWALLGFFALTTWHFGSAEASVLMPRRRTFRDPVWWLFAVGRGLLVVFMALAFRPAEAARVLEPFAGLGEGVAESLAALLRAALPLVWIGTILQILAIRLDARMHLDRAGRQRFAWNVLETCVLLMLFRLAPPLWSFVTYWIAFHAWRHILRLERVMTPEGEALPWWRMLLDFHRRTLVLTLLSLPGLGLVFWAWPLLRGGPGAVAAYLILLSALTVPHALVIGWLDRARMKIEE